MEYTVLWVLFSPLISGDLMKNKFDGTYQKIAEENK